MAPIPCPVQDCQVTFRDDLDANVLISLIQIHERSAHPSVPNTSNTSAEKVKRPTISASGTNEEWKYFLTRWNDYKLATRLTGCDIVLQLLECADDSLRRDLNRTFGSLANSTEEHTLDALKSLAVKPENILVARAQLQNLHQDRDESARAFCARLRGQAGVCNFTKSKTCTCNVEVQVDYSEDIIRDALIRGLSDEDIKLEVLGQCRQDLSLDDTLQMIEAKESGKRSARMLSNQNFPMSTSAINGPSDSSNATSSYRKSNNSKYRAPTKQPDKNRWQSPTCGYCGQKGHGSGKNPDTRRKNCPAYHHQCTKCGIPHHFEKVCHSSAQKKHSNTGEVLNDAIFQDELGPYDSSLASNENFF